MKLAKKAYNYDNNISSNPNRIIYKLFMNKNTEKDYSKKSLVKNYSVPNFLIKQQFDNLSHKLNRIRSQNQIKLSTEEMYSKINNSNRKISLSKKEYNQIKKQTSIIRNFYSNLKLREKLKASGNLVTRKNTTSLLVNNSPPKMKKNLLSSNPLILTKIKDIYSYYLNNSDHSRIKLDKDKSVHFLNKLRDFLEVIKIKNSKNYNKKEKLELIRKTKYVSNYRTRINKEKMRLEQKIFDDNQLDKENSISNIKNTTTTLHTILNNKSYLNDEIKLQFKNLESKYRNESSLSNNYINDSVIDTLRTKLKTLSKNNIVIKPKKRINIKKLKIKEEEPKKEDFSSVYLDKNQSDSAIIQALYNEIKDEIQLNEINKPVIENYFKKKNLFNKYESKRVMLLIVNTLNNINNFNIEKNSKKIYGFFPSNVKKSLENIDDIGGNATKIRKRFIHSICYLRGKKD